MKGSEEEPLKEGPHTLKESPFTVGENQALKREIYGLKCLAGLGDLLFKKEFKNPQIILAGEEELRDLTGFLNLKSTPVFHLSDLNASPLETRRLSLTRKAFHLGAARGVKAVFCATPLQILKKVFFQKPLVLKEGSVLPDFRKLGFQEKDFARNPGEFALRGYLCDIFPPSYKTALRLELEGDRILSIYTLNKDSPSRKEKINEVFLMNFKEWDLKNRQPLCRFLKDRGPGEGKLKILARGEVPSGWEDLMNVLSNNCSLDFFASAEIWIKDPEELKLLFHQESLLKTQKLSPSLSREDIFLPWEKLTAFPSVFLLSKPLPKSKDSFLPQSITKETSPANIKPFKKEIPSFTKDSLSSLKKGSEFQKIENPAMEEDSQKLFPFRYSCYKFQKNRTKNLEENLKTLPVSQFVFISQTKEEEGKLKNQLLLLDGSNKELSLFDGKLLFFLQGRSLSFINERESVAYIQTRDLLPTKKQEEAKQKKFF